MAKEIVIPGLNLLTSLTDDWGGENNTGAAITKYGTEVPAGYKWGVNFAEVERFIKAQFGVSNALAASIAASRVGCLRTWEDPIEEELHLLGFATLEDYEAWFDDHDAVDPITDVVIPRGGAVSAYTLNLVGDTPAAVQMNSNFNVRIKPEYLYNETPMPDPVTLTIQSSTNNQNWVTRGQVVVDPNVYTNVSMQGILPNGNLYVRITGSAYYASTAIPFTFRVNIVNLSLTPATPFHMPFDPANPMTLLFYMTGNVSKSLLLKFDGGGQGKEMVIDNITEVYTDTAYSVTVQGLSSDILTAGRHTIEAQLKYSETVKTEWIESEYLVTGAQSPTIAINNISTGLANWTDVHFFDWSVYTPDGQPMSVVFRLVDSETEEEYTNARWPFTSNPNVKNSFTTPLAIDGVNDTWIDALMLIEDTEGNELHDPIPFGMENEASFAPTAGASFVLTPSVRSNADANRNTIINTVTGDTVGSTFEGFDWQTDGWVDATYNGSTVRVLRIPAGRKLTIQHNPMTDFTSGNNTGNSMVWEIDFVVRNVVDESEPLLTLGAARNNGVWWGFKMLPLSAMMLTADHYTEEDQDLSWAEERRFHMAITAQYGGEGNPNYIRIYLNGVLEREFAYATDDRFTPAVANIVIGNTGSDIDIYGMRCYRMALSSTAIMQDYKASMSTTQEKAAFALANDILDGEGRIDWDRCIGKYNVIGHRGNLLHYGMENNTQHHVSIEIHIVGDEDHSGTLTELDNKGQGTTAMGYYWWNQQYKTTDNTQFLDSEGNPKQDTGKGYAIQLNEYQAKKLVGKVNFASSMQSHKLGLTWAYTDVYKQMLTNGSLRNAPGQFSEYPNARLAVLEKPFLFFVWDEANSRYEFQNLMTFGAGKGDKPTFGFNKSKTPHMLMVEGADNDKPLARFNMPWDDTNITYDADKETWNYNGVKNINFGFGLTDDNEIPCDAEALASIRRFFNFVYLHSTKIEYYNGTLDALQRVEGSSLSPLRWLTSNYDLYRYDDSKPAGEHWVPAGIDNTTLNLKDQYEAFTGNTFNTSQSNANKNNAFKAARLAHFKANVDDIIHVEDMLYHYCFILLFAGTDNRAKNTYYYTDPVGTTITDPITGETVIHHKIRWMQDDLDTVLKTNNVGQNRKPYWVETDTTDENDEYYWQAYDSVLNTLIEEAWDKDNDEGETYNLQRTMRNMLTAMSTLGNGSVMGFFERYLLSTQDYFPAAAYNEQARVVYEYTYRQKMAGSYDNVDPLTQSCGSQRWSEYQWLLDRYMFISSWCQYGEFASSTSAGGLLWSGATGTHYFVLTPAKWLYPRVAVGSSNEGGTALTPPGTAHVFNGVQSQGDTRLYIRGPHYLWKLGDMDQLQSDNIFTFSGRRLQEITVNPEGTNNPVRWSAQAVATTATNIKKFIMRNVPAVSGTLDLSQCVRLEQIILDGTSFTGVKLPSTGALTDLTLPATLETLTLVGCTSLENLVIGGYDAMTEVTIKNTPLADSLYIVQQAIDNLEKVDIELPEEGWRISGAPGLALLNALAAMGGTNCKLRGTIQLTGVTPSFEDKVQWLQAWGDVDNGENGLTITYTEQTLDNVRIISGKYLESVGDHQMRLLSEGNNFTSVVWSISTNNYATINPVTGVVTVNSIGLESQGLYVDVTVTVTRKDGVVKTDTKRFYLCQHVCKLGDYVYADGTFSDELVSYKTVVAICFYINPNNPNDRLAVAKSNVISDQWGLYNNANDGVANVTMNDGSGYNVYDTPIINITSNGTGDIDNVASMDAFANYNRDTAVGDHGFVELTEDIGPYRIGDFIHVGLYKTLQIIRHRNKVLNGVTVDGVDLTQPIEANANQTEREVLTNRIAAIVAAKGNKYRQFYFPAASYCYAYQPSVPAGEVLADHLKAHNWWLPTVGEFGMVYWQQLHSTIFDAARANGNYTNLTSDYCWTSTEYSATYAWFVHGGNGTVTGISLNKGGSRAVRAVVAF